jgi:hypothetical protein
MKSRILIPLLALLLIPVRLSGQDGTEIQGRIVTDRSGEPVPFANIFNLVTRRGTISNVDGYFRIGVSGRNDSIRISYIGFREQVIRPSARPVPVIIRLEESVAALEEVTIRPDDNSRLYEWIAQCRRESGAYTRTDASKAYFELKTFQEKQQIELVEGYFNLESTGYELESMKLKAGRLALQPINDHYFISIESSRTLLLLSLMGPNARFPTGPMELSKARLRRNFYLSADRSYVNQEADSVEVLNYTPKDTTGEYFSGKIWLNRSKRYVEKITMNCRHASRHPFLPLFKADSVTGVNLLITKSFRYDHGQPVFHHIDFTYSTVYKSRAGQDNERASSVETRAVLYAYDPGAPFLLPRFTFHREEIGDYRQIQAMPYNEFFWKNNDEYRVTDSLNSSDAFFHDPKSVTSLTVFEPNSQIGRGLLEHPFTRWTPGRIRFRDLSANVRPDPATGTVPAGRYNLSVKIFADINSYRGTTHVLTATLFDPFESFYYLPLTNQAQCFINLYFDLCEMERRELEKRLYQGDGLQTTFMKICRESQASLDKRLIDFQKEVELGSNPVAMAKYNAIVRGALGIDNLNLFKPFESE